MTALDDALDRGGVRVAWHGPAGEPVVTVTLDRPATRNAQTPSTWRALRAVGDALPGGTRAVVLRSEGPVFSSGIDLRSFTPDGIDGESLLAQFLAVHDAAAADLIAAFQAGFSWWHDRDDVVTVAAVQGAAVGAGFQLALACDLRVCTPDARFAMKEPSLGLVPDLTGTHPLVRAVGYSRALELCLTGRWVGADEALSLGLATSVVPADELDDAVATLVAAVTAPQAPTAAATKGLLRAALVHDADEQRAAERAAQIPLLRGLARQVGL
ncbi:MAG TPA: enoyl-CoA hydratase/isomerase family protein [Candidatus Nanopelagicales bacterium]|nr:enoyl-CoA hydratase/isomerase family protein [Candidatus Nanopelagicales bacterium]